MTSLVKELSSVVPPERVRKSRYDPIMRRVDFKQIKMPPHLLEGDPCTVVEAESAEEVAAVLRWAYSRDVPVYVRQGSGVVSLEIIRPDPPGCLIIDLRRMTRIAPFYDYGYVEVGAAVTFHKLNEYLAPHGYRFPDSVPPVTWGSLVAVNTSGQLVDPRQGKPGDNVLGLKVVLPQGGIMETGTRSIRKPAGFDATHLFIGNQALLGVITDLRLRLIHTPKYESFGLAHFASMEDMGRAVVTMHTGGLPYPQYLEVLDKSYLEFASPGGDYPNALLMVSTDGAVAGEAPRKLKALLDAAREKGATLAKPVTRPQWGKVLHLRAMVRESLAERNWLFVVGDVIDPPLPAFVTAIQELKRLEKHYAKKYPGMVPMMVGHVGGGSFHPMFAAPGDWPYEKLAEAAKEIRQSILELKLKLGATNGEQGVFPGHVPWFHRYYGPLHWDLLKQVKAALDPKNLLNPRRMEA